MSTLRGPRARTLASFTLLSDEVLDHAMSRARTNIDRSAVVASARRVGAPIAADPADRLAEELLRHVSRGRVPRPGLRSLLVEKLSGRGANRFDDELADWIGATAEERGAALVDLLNLTDRLPKPRRTPLGFPGLSRAGLAS